MRTTKDQWPEKALQDIARKASELRRMIDKYNSQKNANNGILSIYLMADVREGEMHVRHPIIGMGKPRHHSICYNIRSLTADGINVFALEEKERPCITQSQLAELLRQKD